MKFSDCLTSVMNGVRVRRDHGNRIIQVFVDDVTNGDHTPTTFTTEDAQADDWQIVVPKPEGSNVKS